MPLSLAESQAVNELADFLYDFLPGTPHPYADSSISFLGVARSLGLSDFWTGGSKRPAIATLLERTLEARRGSFCDLMEAIVRRGLVYRSGKGNSITREEMKALNELVFRLRFKIPALWDPGFLDALPHSQAHTGARDDVATKQAKELAELRDRLVKLNELEPHARGYAFERYLQDLFAAYGLAPRSSFRLVGEQIDGSFQLDADTYLLEAKWQGNQVGVAELLAFHGKVGGKSAWSRGLFVSYGGFTRDGLEAFGRGRPTNAVGMTSQDLYFILNGHLSLPEAIRRKARWAGETGEFYVSVHQLVLEGGDV